MFVLQRWLSRIVNVIDRQLNEDDYDHGWVLRRRIFGKTFNCQHLYIFNGKCKQCGKEISLSKEISMIQPPDVPRRVGPSENSPLPLPEPDRRKQGKH